MQNQKTKNAQKEMFVVKIQDKKEPIVTKKKKVVAQALNNFFLKSYSKEPQLCGSFFNETK